jgi:hypothetical protein
MPSIIGTIEDFIDEIKQDFNINTSFNIKITITQTIEVEDNPDQCLALVTNMLNDKQTQPYQCTRIRRHGIFCGLHYNRKTDFIPIQKHLETHNTYYYISK